jgi:hypothetical protein
MLSLILHPPKDVAGDTKAAILLTDHPRVIVDLDLHTSHLIELLIRLHIKHPPVARIPPTPPPHVIATVKSREAKKPNMIFSVTIRALQRVNHQDPVRDMS